MKKFELVVLGEDDEIIYQKILMNCVKTDHVDYIKNQGSQQFLKFQEKNTGVISTGWYIRKVSVISGNIIF
jgi:hypothetical protein